MAKGFTSSPRIALLATVVLLSFGALGVRLVQLHVIDRDRLLQFVVKARRQIIVEPARRGDILDTNGRLLATSRTRIELGVDPQAVRPEDEAKWPQLARLTGVSLAELRVAFTTRSRRIAPPPAASAPAVRIVLPEDAGPDDAPGLSGGPAPAAPADDADEEDAALDDAPDPSGFRAIHWTKLSDEVDESTYDRINALKIRGVYGTRLYSRTYNGLAPHLVGYVNRAGAPVNGIEAYADFYLRGHNGWREGEVDGHRRELAQFRTREVPRADGYSVTLSIDANVQSIIEDEVAALVRKYQPQKATIVVSDPRTGFILGLANYPTYDLNASVRGELGRTPAQVREAIAAQRNIAVTDLYEPGSVFKIVAASGALEENLVTPATLFDCSLDRILYNGLVRRLPGEDHVFTAPLSVAEIISHSSNRGAAQLAMRLGDQRFYDYARAFGFGHATGFPVGGEISGLMLPVKKWDGLTITRMPMGQSVSVTVLQMHQAMSVIASGGVLLRPQIVREIRSPANEVVASFSRSEVRRVISARTAETMAALLTGVVSENGTAPEAALEHFQVAGKTGTTQKLVDGHYSDRHHVASFVGFFPASRPEIAISVIVDDADAHVPGGVAYGAKVAAPAFKHIGEQLIQYRDIRPVYAPEPGRRMLVQQEGRP